MSKCEQIETMFRPVIEELGYQLWGCEYLAQGKHSILRVYVDSQDGIQIEDCQKVSREVGALLDVEDPISGHYALEVSSPGLERPLLHSEHYSILNGSLVEIKLANPHNKRRKFIGTISQSDDTEVTLIVDEEPVVFSFKNIVKANLVYVEG